MVKEDGVLEKNKMKILGAVVVIGLILFFTVGSPFNNGSDADIQYGGQYYPGEFLLSGHPELWEERDLDVDHVLFSSGGENNQALISGDVDVNCGADSRTISLFNSIPDEALIIGTVQRGNRYATVVREDSDYESWEDLKGETIATRFGTGAEGVLRRFYEEEGYEWDDFDYVNMNVEDMITALDTGQIEAFTAWEPTPAIAEAQGVARVLRTYGDIAQVPASIHTTRDFAENNEDLLVRFLAAQLDKAEMIRDNPEEAAEKASEAAEEEGVQVSPEAFEKIFERINFQIEFDEDIIDEIRDTAEFLKDQGNIEEIPEFSWDTKYLEQAQELRENQ